ncbi:MAG: ABC transporter permease [Candidatus Tectomicrobia bacterium]|nr:ABC transporter permease [Candidatus Tectomicrobia bacterium]
MLGRLLVKSLLKQRSRTLLVLLSAATAATLISAFLSLALQLTEKVAAELRSFGANIVLSPRAEPLEVEIGGLKHVAAAEAAYLDAADLPKIKGIFWRHNIVSFAPFLSGAVEVEGRRVLLVGTWFQRPVDVPGGGSLLIRGGSQRRAVSEEALRKAAMTAPSEATTFRAGVRTLAPWWQVEGRWLGNEEDAVLVGRLLSQRLNVGPGGTLRLTAEGRSMSLPVRGIVATGGPEEEQLFVRLELAQAILGLPGKVEKVQVSALVSPDNALAGRAERIGPEKLPQEEYEKWYCTPYLSSIIHQLEEALPAAKGKAIRRVSEAEAGFLGKMRLTLLLIAGIALVVAALGVMATLMTAIYERREEFGLMKAIGANRSQVGLLLLLESGLTGLAGGALGYAAGLTFTRLLAASVFSAAPAAPPSLALQGLVLTLTLLLSAGVALLGALLPMRGAMRLDPVQTLRGE